MNSEEFEHTLRHEPFQPFAVELIDGRSIAIDNPRVVFGGGAASFLTLGYDLVEFACEQVRAIPRLPS